MMEVGHQEIVDLNQMYQQYMKEIMVVADIDSKVFIHINQNVREQSSGHFKEY